MAERPILFSDPMVKAILAGTKSQTRRVVNPQPRPLPDGFSWQYDHHGQCWHAIGGNARAALPGLKPPYGLPGSTLWVRETWARVGSLDPGWLVYRATYPNDLPANVENVPPADAVTWRPSIHMRRADSRITLRVTSVRVERLQEISEQDAAAEGVSKADVTGWISYRTSFALLWDSINAERAPWASNPWVWVVAFERVLSGDST